MKIYKQNFLPVFLSGGYPLTHISLNQSETDGAETSWHQSLNFYLAAAVTQVSLSLKEERYGSLELKICKTILHILLQDKKKGYFKTHDTVLDN